MSGVDAVTLDMVANHIGADWTRVGCHLNFTTAELERIEMDNANCAWDRIFVMLQKWCQSQQGNDETKAKHLKTALINCGYYIEEPQAAAAQVQTENTITLT